MLRAFVGSCCDLLRGNCAKISSIKRAGLPTRGARHGRNNGRRRSLAAPVTMPSTCKCRTNQGSQKRGERSFCGPVSDLDAGRARGGYTGHRGRRSVDSEPARLGGLLPRRRGGRGTAARPRRAVEHSAHRAAAPDGGWRGHNLRSGRDLRDPLWRRAQRGLLGGRLLGFSTSCTVQLSRFNAVTHNKKAS